MLHEELLVQNIVDEVGVDFYAGEIDSAKGCCAQIANSRRRNSNQDNFVFESPCGEFIQRHVGERDVGIGSRRAMKIDQQPAQIIGVHGQFWAELDARDSGITVDQNSLLSAQAQE